MNMTMTDREGKILLRRSKRGGQYGRGNVYSGVFPKWKVNSVNSANSMNLLKHEWDHFKDVVSHLCLAGTVVASWSLTRDGMFE